MKRDLWFIKDFRPIHGCDGETANLVDDDLSEIPAKEYILLLHHKRNLYIPKECRKSYT